MPGLAALIIGLIIGLFWQLNLPTNYSIYIALFILVLLDRIMQIANAVAPEGSEDWTEILGGALADFALAALLTGLGRQLGVPLYLAPVFSLGNRIFARFSRLQQRMLQISVKRKGFFVKKKSSTSVAADETEEKPE